MGSVLLIGLFLLPGLWMSWRILGASWRLRWGWLVLLWTAPLMAWLAGDWAHAAWSPVPMDWRGRETYLVGQALWGWLAAMAGQGAVYGIFRWRRPV